MTALWDHDPTLTLNGVCPDCGRMNGIPNPQTGGIVQKTATFGFLCSEHKCVNYGTRMNTPFGKKFLADNPSLKILNSRGVQVTIATPAKTTGGTP